MSGERISRLCRDCASSIYGTRAPTAAYADNVARLLFMTAAHESGGFRHRRQLGFARFSAKGAFGLWQCELASVEDSIDYIRNASRRPLFERCMQWLDGWPELSDIDLSHRTAAFALLALQDPRGDPLSCLLARLHYVRDPQPVPATPPEMAAYAKRVYNTRLGAATAADYLRAYERYWPDGR